MKILIHNASSIDIHLKLLDILTSAVSNEELCFTREIDAFTEALLKYRIEEPIVVIQLSSVTENMVIKTLQDLFAGLFLIIVTDTDNPEMQRNCRQLYPRLLVSNKKDYELIDVVIRKCQEIQQS